jgi:hypothetical protein
MLIPFLQVEARLFSTRTIAIAEIETTLIETYGNSRSVIHGASTLSRR